MSALWNTITNNKVYNVAVTSLHQKTKTKNKPQQNKNENNIEATTLSPSVLIKCYFNSYDSSSGHIIVVTR